MPKYSNYLIKTVKVAELLPLENKKTSKLQELIPGPDIVPNFQEDSRSLLRLGKSTTWQKGIEFKKFISRRFVIDYVPQSQYLHSYILLWPKILFTPI